MEELYNFFYTLGKIFCPGNNQPGNCSTNGTQDATIKEIGTSDAPGSNNTQRLMSWIYYAFLDKSVTDLPNLSISDPILPSLKINDNIVEYVTTTEGINYFERKNKPYYSSWVGQIEFLPENHIRWLSHIINKLGTMGLTYYNGEYTYTPSSTGTYSLSASKKIASNLITALYNFSYNYSEETEEIGINFSEPPLYEKIKEISLVLSESPLFINVT